MSTNTKAISDDILEAAEDAAIAIGQTDGDLIEATTIIAKAIHDAVMAERERCATVCSEHISVLRKLFQNDVARAIEQVRAEIKAVSA